MYSYIFVSIYSSSSFRVAVSGPILLPCFVINADQSGPIFVVCFAVNRGFRGSGVGVFEVQTVGILEGMK